METLSSSLLLGDPMCCSQRGVFRQFPTIVAHESARERWQVRD